MASILARLRAGRQEERLDQNDWAQQMFNSNYFNFGGNSYPISYGQTYSQKTEEVPNDFESYANSGIKGNAVVFACCMRRQLVFTEMRFCYRQSKNGRRTDMFGSKELHVLEKPWANGTTRELLSRALQDADAAGNHYVVREGAGQNSTVRRLRPDWVTILLSADPNIAVKSDVIGYAYRPGNTKDENQWEIYPVDGSKGAIAHWAPIPDPTAHYRGMSWLTPVIREIMADKNATLHKEKFFEQGATPQLAISFKDTVSPENFEKFVKMLESHEGVQGAYKTIYTAGGADITPVGAHLAQLNFSETQGHGETRIAAAAGIHPVLVGLSEAIKGTPLAIGNYQAAKDGFGEMFLRPMWGSLCASYQALVPEVNGAELWYDDRDVSFLRQDRQAQADLQLSQAQSANTLIMAGFTPESVAAFFLAEGDWTVLKHSGLTSVQMQAPGSAPPSAGGNGPPTEKSVTPVPKEAPMPSDPYGKKQQGAAPGAQN